MESFDLTRRRRFLVPLFVATSLMAPVHMAQATCAIWKLSGAPVYLRQSDGAVVQLTISRKGSAVAGQAHYFRSYVGKILGILSKGVDVNMRGKVDGVLDGSRLEFKIGWDTRGMTGIYELKVDAFGRITGTSYDFQNPSNRVSIISDSPLACFRQS